jgi:hypothetical protein
MPDILIFYLELYSIQKTIDLAKEAREFNQNIIFLDSHVLNTYSVLCPKNNNYPNCDVFEGMVLPIPFDIVNENDRFC